MALDWAYEQLLHDLRAHIRNGERGDSRSLFAAAELCARLVEIGFDASGSELCFARDVLEPRGMWPLS